MHFFVRGDPGVSMEASGSSLNTPFRRTFSVLAESPYPGSHHHPTRRDTGPGSTRRGADSSRSGGGGVSSRSEPPVGAASRRAVRRLEPPAGGGVEESLDSPSSVIEHTGDSEDERMAQEYLDLDRDLGEPVLNRSVREIPATTIGQRGGASRGRGTHRGGSSGGSQRHRPQSSPPSHSDARREKFITGEGSGSATGRPARQAVNAKGELVHIPARGAGNRSQDWSVDSSSSSPISSTSAAPTRGGVPSRRGTTSRQSKPYAEGVPSVHVEDMTPSSSGLRRKTSSGLSPSSGYRAALSPSSSTGGSTSPFHTSGLPRKQRQVSPHGQRLIGSLSPSQMSSPLKREVDRLQDYVKELEGHRRTMQQQLSSLRDDIVAKDAALRQLAHQKDSVEQQLRRAESEAGRAQSQGQVVEDLRRGLQEANADVKRWVHKCREQEQQLREQEDELSRLTEKNIQLEERQERQDSDLEAVYTLKRQLRTLEEEIRNIQGDRSRVTSALEQSKDRCEQLEEQVIFAKQETADRELDLQRAMQDSQRLAERLQRFENEHDMTVAMKQEMASVQAHLREAENQRDSLEREAMLLRDRCSDAERRMLDKDSTVQQLQEQIARLEERLRHSQQQSNAELDRLNNELMNATDVYAAGQAAWDEDFKRITSALNNAERQIAVLQSELDSAKSNQSLEVERLQDLISREKNNADRLRELLEASRADHHAEVSRLETKIVKLENDAESKDTEIASLQSNLRAESQRARNLQEELDQLNALFRFPTEDAVEVDVQASLGENQLAHGGRRSPSLSSSGPSDSIQSRVEQERQFYENRLRQKQEEIDALQEDYTALRNQYEAVLSQRDHLKGELGSLSGEVSAQNPRLQSLQEELERKNAEVNRLVRERKEMVAQVERMRSESTDRLKDLETDIHRFKMQEDDLEDLRAKNSRLQASLRDRENALIDAQSEKEEALRGKNRELDELQRRIKELEVEANRAATLQKDFDELRQEVLGGEVTTPRKSESGSVLAKQFKAKVERLEDQLQELKQRNLELSRDCMSLSEERKEIRHVLEEKIHSLSAERDEFEAELRRLDGIEQMLEAAERERDQWKEHAMSTEQNLEGVSSSEEVLSRDLKRATLELEQLREEKERLTIEKSRKEEIITHQVEELRRLREAHEHMSLQLTEESTKRFQAEGYKSRIEEDLTHSLKKVRRQKETLEKRFSAKNKESEDFNQQLRELKATIREEGIARQKWKERAEELERVVEKNKKEISRLRENLRKSETEVNHLRSQAGFSRERTKNQRQWRQTPPKRGNTAASGNSSFSSTASSGTTPSKIAPSGPPASRIPTRVGSNSSLPVVAEARNAATSTSTSSQPPPAPTSTAPSQHTDKPKPSTTSSIVSSKSSSKAQHNFSRTLSQADEQLREQDRLREELQQMRLQLEQAEQHHNRHMQEERARSPDSRSRSPATRRTPLSHSFAGDSSMYHTPETRLGAEGDGSSRLSSSAGSAGGGGGSANRRGPGRESAVKFDV